MLNFSESNAWGFIMIIGVLLGAIILANTIKQLIPFLRASLIPTSVLAGGIMLIISITYTLINGGNMFETAFFGSYGTSSDGLPITGLNVLELITYHSLAIGFIATTFKPASSEKPSKSRKMEIIDTGVTTVSTYLIQIIIGMGIALLFPTLLYGFSCGGILLAFGFGQGTGQAFNYGVIYENWAKTSGGDPSYYLRNGGSFGLTIAALGFLSASIGGVIHLNILRKKKKIGCHEEEGAEHFKSEEIQTDDEIPMAGSVEKLSMQLAFVLITYVAAYGIMVGLVKLLALFNINFVAVIYGFNFLFGVLLATLINTILRGLRKKKIMKKQYINSFLMKRIAGFFFDLMVVAGIAAIKFEALKDYWLTFILFGILGAVGTYFYLRVICKKVFPNYVENQFLMMYGMLTGTASTGVILLREMDKDLTSEAAENIVLQNIPAMILGFPLMIIANNAPNMPLATYFIVIGLFIVFNLFLFRKKIFKKRSKKTKVTEETKSE